MDKVPLVYIMANRRNGTISTGVTSDLARRAFEHRTGLQEGVTRRYGCTRLVFVEVHTTMTDAMAREKQIKAGSRARKLSLIEAQNPDWRDLYEILFGPA
jgi:predicted GIY-YIG superfamily endonuclease